MMKSINGLRTTVKKAPTEMSTFKGFLCALKLNQLMVFYQYEQQLYFAYAADENPNGKNGAEIDDLNALSPKLTQTRSRDNISKHKSVGFSANWPQLDAKTLE